MFKPRTWRGSPLKRLCVSGFQDAAQYAACSAAAAGGLEAGCHNFFAGLDHYPAVPLEHKLE